MRLLERPPDRSRRSVTGDSELYQGRRHRLSGYALALVMMAPLVAWSSNSVTAEPDPAAPGPVINESGIASAPGAGQPAPAGAPPTEAATPAETGPAGTNSGSYDLALGKSVFNHSCLTCHGNSVLDAPRIGDMPVWQPRLAQGLDVLIQHALKGHGRMPAKGGYSSLTDHEVSSAVAYVYHVGTEILARQDNPAAHPDCDPVSNPGQCTPEELKRLLVLQMLWLLGGPRQ
jgi:cytochrome c5